MSSEPHVETAEVSPLDAEIVAVAERVYALDGQRAQLASQISQEKDKLKPHGISKAGFNKAYKDYKQRRDAESEEAINKFEEADDDYIVCREALGIPLDATQAELDLGGEPEPEAEVPALAAVQ